METFDLSAKQMKFVDEYIISCNQTDAAIKAGYSKRSADTSASRLLKNDKVKKYLDYKMSLLQKETIATQTEVLEHLTRVMRREEKEHQVVTLREKTEKWVPTGEDGQLKKMTIEKEHAEIVAIPAKLSDTNQAANLIGRRYAMWTDRQEVTGEVGVTIVDDVDE